MLSNFRVNQLEKTGFLETWNISSDLNATICLFSKIVGIPFVLAKVLFPDLDIMPQGRIKTHQRQFRKEYEKVKGLQTRIYELEKRFG